MFICKYYKTGKNGKGQFKIEPKLLGGDWDTGLEDNIAVTVSLKGEMKGSTITWPITIECAELFPRIAFNANSDE